MKYYVNLDLCQNEIKNIVVDTVDTDIVNPKIGQLWFNTQRKALKFYDGSSISVIESTDILKNRISTLETREDTTDDKIELINEKITSINELISALTNRINQLEIIVATKQDSEPISGVRLINPSTNKINLTYLPDVAGVDVLILQNPILQMVSNICTWEITHSLNSKKLVVDLYENSTTEKVYGDITFIDNNNLKIEFYSDTDISENMYTVKIFAFGE